jgi:predicted ribosome quality control (RQC) complex YloA/Tae2 family protein
MKSVTIYDNKLEQELSISIGENAQDNWDIIDKSKQNDLWFHVENQPSSHVILSLPDSKSKCTGQTIIHCAKLCKQHSKFKNIPKIGIIYTEIKSISKGDKVGQVNTKKVSRIVV